MRMLNYKHLLIGGLVLWTSFLNAQTGNKDVTLKGKLQNFQSTVTLEEYSEIARMIPDKKNLKITAKKDSTFESTFSLKEPGYYRLGRNILYLSPGNVIEATVNHNNSSESSFKGKGGVENSYLRNTPFPKGGSFLNAGRSIKNTPQETYDFIMQTAANRRKELLSLKGVSKEFVRLEDGRIRADVIKSFNGVSSYAGLMLRKTHTPDQIMAYETDFNKISKKSYDSLIHNFVDASLLQIEVYRDIIGYLKLDDPSVKATDLRQIQDYKKASQLAYKIKGEGNKKNVSSWIPSIDSLSTLKYKEALFATVNEKLKFGNGDLAKDFTVINTDGKEVKLSDLKGKVIYIDIWATWCGPCMAEMPNLEIMKKKYENHSDLAIVSLSVDETDAIWLRNLATRKPPGIQWRINRAKLSEYEVESIPRYILIDKNFRIVEIDAPEPSAVELPERLNKLLGS
jgi:thiol-disulfide isomerase/thioredoxin